MSDQALILSTVSPSGGLEFSIGAAGLAEKESALSLAALIGQVRTPDENLRAVSAQYEIKRVAQAFERQRKTLKEPIIEAGRKLDRAVNTEIAELDKELGRLSELTSEFQLAEQRRIREEQEAQARELARIEAEKQAELKRIADEQAKAEREAREAREAAERAAREANSKPEREAAAKAMAEANALKLEAEKTAALAAQKSQRIEETAAALTQVEAKPVVASRVVGQVVKTEWDVQVTNPFDLARFHPDCVKIEPLLGAIKVALNEGRTLKGVTATKRVVTDVRAGKGFIDVK